MSASTPLRWMRMFFFLAAISEVSGQVATTTQTSSQQPSTSSTTQQASPDESTLLTFQLNQQALGQSLSALLAQNPNPQQLQSWQQQNSTVIASQQQSAQEMGDESVLQPMAANTTPNIPVNASPMFSAFLTTQAALANAHAQIHNQLLAALPADVNDAQISQMDHQETQLFQQQQAATIQLQAQQGQAVANESAQQPVPLPPPLVVPPDATPQMAAYLTLRDQLARAQINFSNQYLTATPAVRDAALSQWMQQNANQFQQFQAMAQNLTQASPTPEN